MRLIKIKKLKKVVKIFFVLLLVFSWTLAGWPQIPFIEFPPKIREAQAAFPTVAATNTTPGSGATASAVVNLPTGIVSGNLLLVLHRSAVGTAAHAVSGGGWTELFNDISDASDDRISLWYRQADGTEGLTITITQTSSKFASLSWRITGHENPATQAPQFATLATGTSATPDPNSLSPTGGAKDYLWLWAGGWEGEQTSPPASNPTNYTSDVIGASSGVGGAIATNARVASASRQLNAASEDPGSWTISVSDDWTATTIAVHPAPATPVLTQNDWRIYVNNSALDPTDPWGNPDLGENTALDAIPPSNDPIDVADEVRLRMSVAVTTATVAAATEDFILQYKEAPDCTDATAWTDVDVAGGAGTWRFTSLTDVADNTALSVDPPTVGDLNLGVSDVAGRYNRSDPTTTNPFEVLSGEDLEWDWHIQYNGTQAAKTYCFRIVKNVGGASPLDAYNSDSYPRVDIRPDTNDLMRHGNFFTTGVDRGFFWAN